MASACFPWPIAPDVSSPEQEWSRGGMNGSSSSPPLFLTVCNYRLLSNGRIDENLPTSSTTPSSAGPSSHLEARNLVRDRRDIIKLPDFLARRGNADDLFKNFISHTQAVDTHSSMAQLRRVRKDPRPVQHLPTLSTPSSSTTPKSVHSFPISPSSAAIYSPLERPRLRPRTLLLNMKCVRSTKVLPPTRSSPKAIDPSDLTRPQCSSGNFAFPVSRRVSLAWTASTTLGLCSIPRTTATSRSALSRIRRYTQYHQVRQQGLGAATSQALDISEEQRERVQGLANQVKERAKEEALEFKHADEEGDEETKEAKKQDVWVHFGGMKESVVDIFHKRVTEKHGNKANEHFESSERFFTKESSLKSVVVVECQKHNDYQQSMTWLLDALREYFDHPAPPRRTSLAPTSTLPPRTTTSNRHSRTPYLLECFSNNTSVDFIFDTINVLSEFREGLKDVNTYVHRILFEPP
ncbi:hypothetical protein NMY22_g11602 [Coprinellus aureogranulatus]|nr:hypothetical protein NMY22_g11602 [Coprinellus aureogranulatus]